MDTAVGKADHCAQRTPYLRASRRSGTGVIHRALRATGFKVTRTDVREMGMAYRASAVPDPGMHQDVPEDSGNLSAEPNFFAIDQG